MEIQHIYNLENSTDIFDNEQAIKEHIKYKGIYKDFIINIVKDLSQKLPLNIDLFKNYNHRQDDYNFTNINGLYDILEKHFEPVRVNINPNKQKLLNFTEHDFYNFLNRIKDNSKQELKIHYFNQIGVNFFTHKNIGSDSFSAQYRALFYIFRELEIIGYIWVDTQYRDNSLTTCSVPTLYSNDPQLIKVFADIIRQTDFSFEETAIIINLKTTKENPNSIGKDYHDVPTNKIIYPDKNNYPTLNFNFENYFKEFVESKSNLLLLYGPPGTGKTTLLRELTKVKSHTCVIAESNILRFSFDEIKSNLCKKDILIIEDADDYLGSRKDGNQVMSSLLNGLDGFISGNGIKVVFNTNITNLSSIDEALIRPGRCFDVLHVPMLTSEQALKIATDNNIQIQDFNSKKNWSLAEVYNPPVKEYSNSRTKAINLGFNK